MLRIGCAAAIARNHQLAAGFECLGRSFCGSGQCCVQGGVPRQRFNDAETFKQFFSHQIIHGNLYTLQSTRAKQQARSKPPGDCSPVLQGSS
jgi:hypothetical protein